jgi:NADH oxidase (H2O-forming)
MNHLQLNDAIFPVGTLDSLLRMFDVIMPTQFGTSYNSYLIRDEKITVVEGVKAAFADVWLDNIRRHVDPKSISYLILNHMEPDHTGAIPRFLEAAPQAQVVLSKVAAQYYQNLFHNSNNLITVGDGDTLNIGKRTLKFYFLPFLHWPDSMFTWSEVDKTLFTCDVYGCHFCDERAFESDVDDFSEAFRFYYEVIFRTWKDYVLKANIKVRELNPAVIAPSHGPILNVDPMKYVQLYEQWSQPLCRPDDPQKKVLVLYESSYGNTARLAEAMAEGAQVGGAKVNIKKASDLDFMALRDEVEAAHGILLGSPTFMGDAVEPIWKALSAFCTIPAKGKKAAVFGSYGWSGEGAKMLQERLRGLKLEVLDETFRVRFNPKPEDLDGAKQFAAKFVGWLKGEPRA